MSVCNSNLGGNVLKPQNGNGKRYSRSTSVHLKSTNRSRQGGTQEQGVFRAVEARENAIRSTTITKAKTTHNYERIAEETAETQAPKDATCLPSERMKEIFGTIANEGAASNLQKAILTSAIPVKPTSDTSKAGNCAREGDIAATTALDEEDSAVEATDELSLIHI